MHFSLLKRYWNFFVRQEPRSLLRGHQREGTASAPAASTAPCKRQVQMPPAAEPLRGRWPAIAAASEGEAQTPNRIFVVHAGHMWHHCNGRSCLSGCQTHGILAGSKQTVLQCWEIFVFLTIFHAFLRRARVPCADISIKLIVMRCCVLWSICFAYKRINMSPM